ncbi:hypothetical protein EDC04DRAFT_2664041 [Pisolithus marmoratus]|nr:hypothetical protein EDC04DRAFT_2664041 [Pisolithus marmoratus]
MYDYALTFEKEIDLFWLQPHQTWPFAFFIANRYIGLLSRILVIFAKFFSNSSGLYSPLCSGLLVSAHLAAAVLQIIGTLVMIARVYAFYNKDRRVASFLLVTASIATGMCCWALSYRRPPPTLDQIAAAHGTHAGCPGWAAAWSGQLLVDGLVFIFTLRKLISARSLGKRTFMALSLRDGIYDSVMTAANVANITMYFVVSDPSERSMLTTPTNMLALCGNDL